MSGPHAGKTNNDQAEQAPPGTKQEANAACTNVDKPLEVRLKDHPHDQAYPKYSKTELEDKAKQALTEMEEEYKTGAKPGAESEKQGEANRIPNGDIGASSGEDTVRKQEAVLAFQDSRPGQGSPR